MSNYQSSTENNAKLLASSHVYFIGIGGIGMSALARYFHAKGAVVSGYDKTATSHTDALTKLGISIVFEDDISNIPTSINLVVYTPAIPATHLQLQYLISNGYTVVKRSDVLQWITENSFNICVGGTHGKTTISTMVAHILRDSAYGCNAFLGGISANYNTNFWSSNNNVAVIEADEYDRSFLKLVPDIAIITAVDSDHLDIYKAAAAVEDAFIEFAGKIKPTGTLITNYSNRVNDQFISPNIISYHISNTEANVYASSIEVVNGAYHFSVFAKNWQLNNVVLNMGGLHNVENTIAAITVAKLLNISDEKIIQAVANFKGIKRRFDFYLRETTKVLIDDYAHHPEELKALINGVKSLFHLPITIVFQPHLFSRTIDMADAFAESLSMADEVLLLPIYAARELPIDGITSNIIASKIGGNKCKEVSKQELLKYLVSHPKQLVVMAGAGDIDVLVTDVKKIMEQQ